MRVFVLDENVLELGLRIILPTPKDFEAFLLNQIEANAHKIAWNKDTLQIYLHRLDRLHSLFPSPARRFRNMLFNPDIFVQNEEALLLENEDPIRDAPDLPFVRLAAAVDNGAVLATTDGPLREEVIKFSINTHHNFHILSPEEALPYSGPDG